MIMERNPELDFGLRYDDDYSLINYINNLNNPEKVNNIVFRNNDQNCCYQKEKIVIMN